MRSGRAPSARQVTALAALLVFAATALAACSTSPSSTSASTTSTTSRHSGGNADGSEINKLPTSPSPSTKPTAPNLSTPAAQTAYLQSVFNDIQAMWQKEFTAAGATYLPARLNLFQAQVSTSCGVESATGGPFYCSGDKSVYLDIKFFAAMEKQFGVKGDFAQAYVVAHELGHHVQNLLGITNRVGALSSASPSQTNALSVRVELQADCFAGVWAHSVYQRTMLNPGDIDNALHAAEVVGDDFLANATGATNVTPDTWTHGSSAQRQQWFTTGYENGRPSACDTFASRS